MKSKKMEVAPTMPAAAVALSIHTSEIKRAKRGGSDAFLRSGRIDLARLRAWLKSNPVETNSQDGAPHPELAGIDMDGLMKSLASAAEVEGKNLQLLRSAQARGDAVAAEAATAAFGRSQKNKLAVEAAVRKERVARGELLTVDQAKIQINKLHVPTVTLLRKLPRTVASKVALGNEVTAEKILAEAVEDLISELKRAVQGEPDPQLHRDCWMALVLQNHGPAKLVELLEEARAEVIRETSEDSSVQAEKPATAPEKPPGASEF